MAKILTNKGLQIIANRIKGNLSQPLNIAWGTGTTAPSASDTALEAEDVTVGYARVAGVSSLATISSTEDTYVVSGTLTAAADLQITEWGLFDSEGDLMCREVILPGHTLVTGQGVSFVFKFQGIRS